LGTNDESSRRQTFVRENGQEVVNGDLMEVRYRESMQHHRVLSEKRS
jgi:hypothetical protein